MNNIKYRTIAPPEKLGHIVKNYFVLEGGSKTYNLFQFADTNAKLFFMKDCLVGFCNSNNLQKTTLHNGRVIRTHNDVALGRHSAVLLGPCHDYCVVKFEGNISIIGIEFQPTGAWHILGKSVDKFADSLTILNDEIISGIALLSENVKQSQNPETALSAISFFISSKTDIVQSDSVNINNINTINEILKNTSPFNKVSDIAADQNITAKQMQRIFRKYTGITPIQYFLIMRFKSVLRLLSEYQHNGDVSKIAEIESYYDNSHLNKETKRLAGHTPAVLQETGNIIKLIENMAIVFEDQDECTFCIYSH